jgi:hypothetical protein
MFIGQRFLSAYEVKGIKLKPIHLLINANGKLVKMNWKLSPWVPTKLPKEYLLGGQPSIGQGGADQHAL